MAAAVTEFRQAVIAQLEAEFAVEGFPVRPDKLHESLGNGAAIAGVSPDGERPSGDSYVHVMRVTIQVFDAWDAQIDPEQEVDPAKIEGWAWRLQRRFKDNAQPNTSAISYWLVDDVFYPDDPTGNKSRFIMALIGYGSEPTLDETAA